MFVFIGTFPQYQYMFSPANVDASVMYRRWKDTKGKDKEYENIIR